MKSLRSLFLLLALALAAAPSARTQPAPQARNPWLGQWIWLPGEPSPKNAYAYFRKAFELEGPQKTASINITADSRYQVFVNGAFVGRGPVRSDRRWLYYDNWDLAPHLKKGKNVIAVLVHHYGEWTFQYQHGRGGLIADVVGSAGRSIARTDATWKCRRAEAWEPVPGRMSIQLGFAEVYDARKEPAGWKTADFSDAGWAPAVELGPAGMKPWTHLVKRDIPPMLEEPHPAARLLETAAVDVPEGVQHVDLLPLMEPKTWGAAYLTTTLVSPDERDVELKFGSDDALKVWLNGQEVVSRLVDRAAAPDQESARATLKAGENRLLAKVVQGHTGWEFYFRMAGNTQGVLQRAGNGTGAAWQVVGPFPFAMDPTLRRGFEAVYPPEQAYRESYQAGDRRLEWKTVRAGTGAFGHVSRQMAAGRRGPIQAGEVENPERLLQAGQRGTRVRTGAGRGISFLVDFGKEVTGFPRFRVRGARGGEVIDVGYGEVLHDEKGGFLPQNTDRVGRLNPDRDDVHYADRYVCRAGDQEYQTFDKRGFRYLQLDVRNAAEGLEIDNVSLLFSTYPVEYRGAFQSSDDRLNRIWEIGRWTCQLNMEDGYTDCPWRERAQWWGDARVEALINYYSFGDHRLIKKCLRQQAQSLNDEGMLWGVYPTDWDGGRLPSFTLIWVSTLWETYQYTGDRELLRELYPTARATLDRFFAPRVGPRGLLKDIPYWVFLDWAPVDDKGESGALNAYYYDALRSAAAMGKLLGEDSAAEYERRAAAVKDAMNRHLWDSAVHAYRDSLLPDGSLSPKITQQTNSLCVLFDIAPPAEHPRILDFIYAPENKARVVEAGSPYFSFYQLGALFHAGRHEQALGYIRDRWGRMLDWGATTWWETWQPGASFCHGWSGGPTYNLGAEVLGVKPLKPAFAEVSVAPNWVGLGHASGVVPTPKGEVRVGWTRDARTGNVAIRVGSPEGVPLEVTLPAAGAVTLNKKPRLPMGVEKAESPAGTVRYRLVNGGELLLEQAGR